MQTALGLNACRAGWMYFRFDGDTCTFGVQNRIAGLVEPLADDACALISVPIGLRQRGKKERACDLAVRSLLGPRRSSVFAAPMRSSLKFDNYADASARNRELSGRALARQAWSLAPRIREVDQLMKESAIAGRVLRESRPELLFAALAGGPMAHSKTERAGFTERMTILSILYPDSEQLIASAFLAHGGFDANRDEVVDAFVLALCARWPSRLRTLPAEPETDPRGLPMRMVYLPGRELLT
ncbi:MAG TPA: DUF429 domain-containing protein [Chromatiales bacterium]|nr:DUF429 domain-containing protein [Chromatiales bacterium]